MIRYLAAYLGTAVVMVALDTLWLGVVARPLYEQGIGHLMADRPKVAIAIAFHLVYAVGVVSFAVGPQHGGSGWAMTLAMGALFGLLVYATYDLTNLATLRDWPWRLTLIDIGWGITVSAASAAGGKAALDRAMRAWP